MSSTILIDPRLKSDNRIIVFNYGLALIMISCGFTEIKAPNPS